MSETKVACSIREPDEQEVQLLSTPAADLQQRVLIVLRHGTWWATAATAAQRQRYVQMGGVKAVAALVSAEWPPNADLTSSQSASDVVLSLTPDLDPPVLAWGPASGQELKALQGKAGMLLRSLRRAAADVVLLMLETHAPVVVDQLWPDFFNFLTFIPMIRGALERYVPAQSLAAQTDNADQVQAIAQRLLAIAVCAAEHNPAARLFLAKDCACTIFKVFTDPWQAKWEKKKVAALQRQSKVAAVAAAGVAGASSRGRIWADLQPPGMSAAKMRKRVAQLQEADKGDIMVYTIGGFVIQVINRLVSTISMVQAMIEHSDALSKVDAFLGHPVFGPPGYEQKLQEGLCLAASIMGSAWSTEAYRRSKELEQERAGVLASAAAHKQAGNKAFGAGDYQTALSEYGASVRLNPTDAAVFSNISVVQLKMGRVNEAYAAGMAALGHDPTWNKAWMRVGDACREAGRWQLAHLCFTAALLLHPDDTMRERQEGAAAHLARAWSWSDVPTPWDAPGVAAWMDAGGGGGRSSRRRPQEDVAEQWLKRITNTEEGSHTSRRIATHLKQHYLTALAARRAAQGAITRLPGRSEWQLGWGDTPITGVTSGQPKYALNLADHHLHLAAGRNLGALGPLLLYEGLPSPADVLQAVALTCLYAPFGGAAPYKPALVKLPYRMLDSYAALHARLHEWGVANVVLETFEESRRSSMEADTDMMGNNYADQRVPEKLLKLNDPRKPDTHNDQLPAPRSSSSAGGAAGAGAGGIPVSGGGMPVTVITAPPGSQGPAAPGAPGPECQPQGQQMIPHEDWAALLARLRQGRPQPGDAEAIAGEVAHWAAVHQGHMEAVHQRRRQQRRRQQQEQEQRE